MVATSKDYIKNNPLNNTNTCIIVPSYEGHLLFLKYSLQKYKETGKYVILAYDNKNLNIPPKDVLSIPDSVVMPHKFYGATKRNGWLWNIVYASGIVSLYENFKYIVTTNSDCVWDRPKEINDLIKLLGNYDIMSASSEENLIHTCCVLWKRECFLNFVNYIKKKLENNIPESYSPEVLLRDFIKSNNYKNKFVLKQPTYPKGHRYEGKIDHYSSYNQDSTFKYFVGYRNLGAEMKTICQEHLEPIEKKYFDLRDNGRFFNKHEQETLYWFYYTEDRRYLYKYWGEGEDSYWNRRYYKLNYYGLQPLYDDSKRNEFGPPSERLGHFNRWEYNSYILKDDEYFKKWKEVIEK